MSNEVEKMLEELKSIRLELFRSAANLDGAITEIESYLVGRDDTNWDSAYAKLFIKTIADYRGERIMIQEWDKLPEKEAKAWLKCINEM